MLAPFDKTLIKPASINLRIARLHALEASSPLSVRKGTLPKAKSLKLPYTLKPGEYIVAETVESFDLPSTVAILHLQRTRATRLGLQILGGYGDPGYHGTVHFGIHNIGGMRVVISEGDSLSKIIVFPVDGQTVPLLSRFLGGRLV